MSDKTTIEWTQATWNPTVGCDRVSPGCANCYAKTQHDRRHKAFLAGKQMAPQYAQPFEVLQMLENRLDAPLRRRKPTTYFVNSVSDLFHESVPDAFIDRVFATMALSSQHTFQILTKRAERMRNYMSAPDLRARASNIAADVDGDPAPEMVVRFWPLLNVWLGVSVENQRFADERIPLLLGTPAAIRFISAEPLLGPVNLAGGGRTTAGRPRGGYYWLTERPCSVCLSEDAAGLARGSYSHPINCGWKKDHGPAMDQGRGGIDWVIVGGESGRSARPFHTEWAATIVRQCQAANVPVFVKQLGADPRWGPDGWLLDMLRDPKGGDIAEWPDYYVGDLKIRQFPDVRR